VSSSNASSGSHRSHSARATGTLTGVLKDERTHKPIAGACIQVHQHGNGYVAHTRANGQYRITGIPTGRYQVEVNFPSCYHFNVDYLSTHTFREVTITAGATATVSASLPRDGELEGRVVNATTGQPIAGLCAVASGSWLSPVHTNANGTFIIGGLTDPATLSFEDCRHARGYQYPTVWYPNTTQASAAKPIPVGYYKSQRGIEIKDSLTGGVSGTVHNESGQPVAELCVMADNGLGNDYQFVPNDGQDSVSVTNASGEFTDEDLPAGSTYRVFAAKKYLTAAELARSNVDCTLPPYYYFGGNENKESGTLVTVNSGQTTTGINIVIPQAFLPDKAIVGG